MKSHSEWDENCLSSDGYFHLTPQISHDLKVELEGENFYDVADDWTEKLVPGLIGYHVLENVMSFFGVLCGGDWQTPTFWWMVTGAIKEICVSLSCHFSDKA